MSKMEKALRTRLLFEIARSEAFKGGVAGGPGAEQWIGALYDHWNRLERQVEDLEKNAAQEEKKE